MSHREKLIPGAVVKTAAFLRATWRGAAATGRLCLGSLTAGNVSASRRRAPSDESRSRKSFHALADGRFGATLMKAAVTHPCVLAPSTPVDRLPRILPRQPTEFL